MCCCMLLFLLSVVFTSRTISIQYILGAAKKCFVCCQFDRCNALEHHYFQSSKSNDDDNLEYSAFNKATRSWEPTWSSMLFLSLPLVAWMLT